jgi:heptosyltransferase II
VVDVVVTPAAAPLLANNPDIRRVIEFDKRSTHAGWRGLRAMARELRPDDPGDVAYLAQGSWRSAALAYLAGYQTRIGFDTSAGRRLYSRRVRFRADRHHAERLWRLAAQDDAHPTPEQLRPRLYPGSAERSDVDALLAGAGWSGEPLIALAPGSIWGTKRWPYYADLARRLTSSGRLVVLGSAADAPLAAAISAATFGSAIEATGRLSLLASAALLERCVLAVTNDSAPQHLASAAGTPTISIFGPTVPAFGFGPLAPHSTVVEHHALPCRPCDPHGPMVCPLGHWRCMRDLDVDLVFTEVQRALSGPSAASDR